MALANKIIWHIETRLQQPLDTQLLSSLCCVSPFHMARAFRVTCGISPMAYLRARRLSEAARVLASGTKSVTEVAFDFEYGSHQAFTRAFTRHFGHPPSHAVQTLDGLVLSDPIEMEHPMTITIEKPRIVSRAGFRVVGAELGFNLTNLGGITSLWQSFAARESEVSSTEAGCAYGVCHSMTDTGDFKYMAGYPSAGTIPQGMNAVDIPDARYAVFTHKGHISTIGETTAAIWDHALTENGLTPADTPNFEFYDAQFDANTGRGDVEIWIPIV
jgi:AraC family transcriptional regulator